MRKIKYDFITVDSTAIQSMRYYKEQRNLLVKFQNDTNYLYKDIPVRLFQKMRNSYSIGKFFNKHIKNNFIFDYDDPRYYENIQIDDGSDKVNTTVIKLDKVDSKVLDKTPANTTKVAANKTI
jgi:lysyl-tRNA synthetase class 2